MATPIEQLLSRTVYNTDGATSVWDFSFSGGYIYPAHVKAYTEAPDGNRTDVTLTLTGPYQVTISPPLAVGSKLVIYRDTPKDLPLVDFADESGFSETALDTNARQAVFIAAEAADIIALSNFGAAVEAAELAASSASAANIDASSAASSASAAASSSLSAGLAAVNAASSAAAAANTVASLQAADGATLVGADDESAGTLWSTVQGALGWLKAKWGDLAASYGASLVGYLPAGTGAVATYVQSKLRERVSVIDFGADPTGVLDSTDAFNLASMASIAHTGNDHLAMRREIIVPAGDFMIAGTVYVRKGQMLKGAGDGATRITAGPQTSTGRVMFKLGYGKPSGVETQDPGGLPPVIENMHTFGGDAAGPVIEMAVPGAQARDLFITSCGVGIFIGGGDTITTRCIVDQGLNGMAVTGQNHIINSCLFYNMRYGITINSGTYDAQIGDCHFEYSQTSDIVFADGSTDIQNVMISDCQFVKNSQYAGLVASIQIRGNSLDLSIKDCNFRNDKGYAINNASGLASKVRISDCIFDGSKTNPVYEQSTTASGIYVGNGIFEIIDCSFINLYQSPILINYAFSYKTTIRGCNWEGITGATSFISLTGSTGSISIYDCTGDNVLPLINAQSGVGVSLRGNKKWLGAIAEAAGRYFVKIPTQYGAIIKVGIMANTSPGGFAQYSTAISVMAMRRAGYSGSALTDYATLTTAFSAGGDGYVPAISAQIDFDAVGSGAALAWSNIGRYLVVSVPNSYANVTFEADFDI